jgi:hypothetical protein
MDGWETGHLCCGLFTFYIAFTWALMLDLIIRADHVEKTSTLFVQTMFKSCPDAKYVTNKDWWGLVLFLFSTFTVQLALLIIDHGFFIMEIYSSWVKALALRKQLKDALARR